MNEEANKKLVGKITHYFDKIGVAVIEISDELNIGDEILIEGAETNFTQKVDSMQAKHENIEKAKAGDAVGMKVSEKVRENDQVYKILE